MGVGHGWKERFFSSSSAICFFFSSHRRSSTGYRVACVSNLRKTNADTEGGAARQDGLIFWRRGVKHYAVTGKRADDAVFFYIPDTYSKNAKKIVDAFKTRTRGRYLSGDTAEDTQRWSNAYVAV